MKRIVTWVSVLSLFVAMQGWAQRTDAPAAPTVNPTPTFPGAVPRLIKFSGALRDSIGKPLTGPVDVTFAIYQQQNDATPIWNETQAVPLDAQGRYTVLLGSVQPEGMPMEVFISGEARWLEVRVGGAEPQPRTLLVSVPYALKAGDAETLGGKPASAFLSVESQPPQGASSGTVLGATLAGSGRGGTGTVPTAGASDPPCSSTAGTLDHIARFTTTVPPCTIGNSVIFEKNVGGIFKVGIGPPFPPPVAKLDILDTVNGDFNLPSTSSSTVGVIKLGGTPFIHAFSSSGPPNANTFVGLNAGNFITAGGNTAIGFQALMVNSSGSDNTASGGLALTTNSTGIRNTADGSQALLANTSGSSNTATGFFALGVNTTGSSNTASGEQALAGNTMGSRNTANGFFALHATTGDDNTAIGVEALVNNHTGSRNTAVGEDAGVTSAFGSNNTFIGALANVAPSSPSLTNATAIGYQAIVGASNSLVLGGTGVKVGIGTATPTTTLEVATPGDVLIDNGDLDLPGTTSLTVGVLKIGGLPFMHAFGSSANTFVGANAGNFFTTGSDNTASGSAALASNTMGAGNTASGLFALTLNTMGNRNTAVGTDAGGSNDTGSNNTFIGAIAGFSNRTGSNNTIIGANADAVDGLTNATAIGSGAVVGANNALVLGGTLGSPNAVMVGIGTPTPVDTLQVEGDIRVGTSGSNGCVKDFGGGMIAGTACSSDVRLKTNIQPFSPVLNRLVQLQPVHFNWRVAEYPEYHFGPGTNSGLIAQEVEKVFPELVTVDARGFRMVNYSALPYLMLQAMRELKAENDALRAQIESQGKRINSRKDNEVRQVRLEVEELCKMRRELAALKARMSQDQANVAEGKRTAEALPEAQVRR
jgi:hypothetical protein